jgi:hypothetical protein
MNIGGLPNHTIGQTPVTAPASPPPKPGDSDGDHDASTERVSPAAGSDHAVGLHA